MKKHVQILGILNIVWGALGLLGALIVMAIFGGAAGIIGTAARHDPGAGVAISIVSFVGGLIFLVLLIASVPSVVAGVGLVNGAPWARILAIIVSVLHLFNIPIGTALGIYGLWVLLSQETQPGFAGKSGPIRI
jgi:hypothetical protein